MDEVHVHPRVLNPSGVTISAERREEWSEIAQQQGVPIVKTILTVNCVLRQIAQTVVL
jgi:hypothetical protein